MPSPLVRIGPPRLLVGDTGVLLNEVVQGARQDHLTALLAALHQNAARLYIAAHVLVEMERDLPGYAADRGVDPAPAVERWNNLYLPYTVVVAVPDTWGGGDERVLQVANRHPVDLPTARLAVALAPCHALVQDRDLTDNGFGDANWLPLTLASANQAEIELIGSIGGLPTMLSIELAKAAGRAFAKLPDWAQALLLLAGLVGLYWWQQDSKAQQHINRVLELARKTIEVVGPPAVQIFERYTQAQVTWETNVVQPGSNPTLSEQIARLLAEADRPMTATEMTKLVNLHDTPRDRGDAIRAELRRWDVFTEVLRGRWRLGQPASTAVSAIQHTDVAEWLRRAHRGKVR